MSEITGRQTFGLGRPLRDLLPRGDERSQRPAALFGESEPEASGGAGVLEAALALCAASLPDDLWGCCSSREDGGSVTRLAGDADAVHAWALADVLRHAAADQLPAAARADAAVCFAVPVGTGAAIGLRRTGRPLAVGETAFLQAVATACVLATGVEVGTRRR